MNVWMFSDGSSYSSFFKAGTKSVYSTGVGRLWGSFIVGGNPQILSFLIDLPKKGRRRSQELNSQPLH